MTAPLLEVRHLTTRFHTTRGVVRAVEDVSLRVDTGETLAIVGESGSGKSVTALSLLRMVRRPGRIESGEIRFKGEDIMQLPEPRMRQVRGAGISMIFQDPMTSLNPAMRIRDQLVEAMTAHGKFTGRAALDRAVELMTLVGIPAPEARLADYPHSMSGGMRQRVMIATAVANQPSLIIADEPTTALDVTIQAQILDLLTTLNRELGTAVILITHNMGVVARVCQRAAVMYAGRIVEQATVDDLFGSPRHPYTRDLLAATPRLSAARGAPLVAIEGRPPDLIAPPPGCSFAPRCRLAEPRCHRERPELATDGARGWACWISDRARASGHPLPDLPAEALTRSAGKQPSEAGDVLLAVDGVTKAFPVGAAGLMRRGPRSMLHAIDDVSLVVRRGEAVGLVGESGCGKSTLARVVLGIHHATSGRVSYRGTDLTTASRRELRGYRRHVQLVFQDPYSSLNPRATIGAMLREPIVVHGLASGPAAGARVHQLLEMVGLDPAVATRYPHEFSGGQRQRIAIARALAVDPQVIVCDEAVSALDVSLQAQILNLLDDLRARLGLAYVFIGHDLATVRYISDRIAVMYLGQIVEEGPAEALVANPRHPYTASLLSAAPEPDPAVERTRERIVLSGDVPSPLAPPLGCRFHTRCPIGPLVHSERQICIEQRPELADSVDGHRAACHFPGELRRAGLAAAAAGVNGEALARADGGAA